MIRYRVKIFGLVQGVGFRPYISRLANRFNLIGFVSNDSNGLTIEIQGKECDIESFFSSLSLNLPILSQIDKIEKKPVDIKKDRSFIIKNSKKDNINRTNIPKDIAICQKCISDMENIEMFKDYFYTSCCDCGPRFTTIKELPYDREKTSFSKFNLCQDCQSNYSDINNRRFHAQNISCKKCGPKLEFIVDGVSKNSLDINIFKDVAKLIEVGKIGAIKSVGGFHIVCSSSNTKTIKKLREYKNRKRKPFALMFKDIKEIEKVAFITHKEIDILSSKERPIVILNRRDSKQNINRFIAPNIDKIGCFLPTNGLYYLLFKNLNEPIIATSANRGGSTIISNRDELLNKLKFLDFVVDYNIDILNRVDDSLVQLVDNSLSILRASRGYTPKVIILTKAVSKNILAVGASSKSSISIAFDNKIILSPYLGDIDSIDGFNNFKLMVKFFKNFYSFKPDIIVCDKHPNYQTRVWAYTQKLEIFELQHHLAHLYSVKAEFSLLEERYTSFIFDGSGYGDDKTIWGGEVFIGDSRKYNFRPIKLLGASKAIKEPRRVALSMLFDRYSLDEVLTLDSVVVENFTTNEIKVLYNSYIKNINSPSSSSVGRLFDGLVSFANILHYQDYEGESGLLSEKYYNKNIEESFNYSIDNGVINIDFDFFSEELISKFYNTLSKIVFDIAIKESKDVVLSGGVFQNVTLMKLILDKLKKDKIKYYYNKMTPINDSNISLGQAYYYIQNMEKK